MPAGASEWEINLAAARQFKAREGHLPVPRPHTDTVTDAEGRQHPIRLRVFRSNTRSHHKQHKLTSDQAAKPLRSGFLLDPWLCGGSGCAAQHARPRSRFAPRILPSGRTSCSTQCSRVGLWAAPEAQASACMTTRCST
ncbi:helicase associated domain-containing protein [Streptomyces sp. 3N207]|uniref:helicase associated domain-containing protein n=1 Tax=Streptomyces sp. 3N207 TaxID=3457417 RepID=UPI003FD1ED00